MDCRHCRAIKENIDNKNFTNITAVFSKIKPADNLSQSFKGEKSSKNETFVK